MVSHVNGRQRQAWKVRCCGFWLVTTAIFLMAGCQTTNWARLSNRLPKVSLPFHQDRQKEKLAQEDKKLRESVDQIGGPLRRVVARVTSRDSKQRQFPSSVDKAKLERQFNQAKQLFDAGKYAEAEKAFKKIVNQGETWLWRLTHTDELPAEARANPYREDALFYLAETQYKQQRYPKAVDNYIRLMNQYPSTQYLDKATRRLFEVAKLWLGAEGFKSVGDIQQVAGEKELKEPGKLPEVKAVPILPNLTDRRRPVFDTAGYALSALKAIWLNDPTGPLADDALMLAAVYHLKEGHYNEADHLFQIIREEYPNSPHLANAFLLGSQVKLMSYQGADYDESALLEAEKLKKTMLRVFPNLPEKDRIKKEIEEIEQAKAERDWKRIQFYMRKRKLESAAVYCRLLLQEHPDSPYAQKARDLLAQITKTPGTVRLKKSEDRSLLPLKRLNLPKLKPVPSSNVPDEQSGQQSEQQNEQSDVGRAKI